MYQLLFAWFLCLISADVLAAPAPNWADKLIGTGGVEGGVFFEGDMILPKSLVKQAVDKGNLIQEYANLEKIFEEGEMPEIGQWFKRWTNGVVPYVVHDDLKCSFLECLHRNPESHILNAMKEWADKTCITFREKQSTDHDYVHFVSAADGVCASWVGRTGHGRQPVYVGKGCREDGIMIHLIGHALGFFHEQSRPDRDQFVTVNYNNIKKKDWINFHTYTTDISELGTAYDYASIMHSGRYSWPKTPGVQTIIPKRDGVSIGQRIRLSPIDIEEANLYYECPPK